MKFLPILLIILFAYSSQTFGQTDKKKATSQSDLSNSFEPYSSSERSFAEKEVKKSKRANFRKAYFKSLDQKKIDFQKRMVANAKYKKKVAKEMKKPQYSNPLYFGHKRKPKKRPVGKRKLCKECGIVH